MRRTWFPLILVLIFASTVAGQCVMMPNGSWSCQQNTYSSGPFRTTYSGSMASGCYGGSCYTPRPVQQPVVAPAPVAHKPLPCCVRVITQEAGGRIGSGGGTLIKQRDGRAYILTCQHGLESAQGVEVEVPGVGRVPAACIGEDADLDLAVLVIRDVGVAGCRRADAMPRIGAKVYAAGYNASRFRWASGSVQTYAAPMSMDTLCWFEMSAVSSQGDSGSGVFSPGSNTILLGVVIAGDSQGTTVAAVAPFRDLIDGWIASDGQQDTVVPVPDEDTEQAVEPETSPCAEIGLMIPIVQKNSQSIASLLDLVEANSARLDKIEAWPMPERGEPGPVGPQGPPGPAGVFDPASLTDAQLSDLAQRLPPIHVEVEMLEKPPENPQHNQDVRLGEKLPLRLYLVPPQKQ